MTRDLIINPYAGITILEKNKKVIELQIEVPIPNESQKSFKIEMDSQPELVQYLIDLTKCGFSQFKPEDLNSDELQFLLQKGFLVEKNLAPKKPLFYCFLDEIDSEKDSTLVSTENLIVNPSCRFEVAELSNFSHLMNDNFFLPDFPIAWIRLPATEIEIAYWLRDELIEIAQKLVPNEKLSFNISEHLLAKLVQSNILINPQIWSEKEQEIKQNLQKNRQKFSTEKYAVLKNILPAHYMEALKRFFREYIKNGFMPYKDVGIKRFYQHNLPLAQFLHRNFTRLMSIIVGEEVKPSYVFAASYINEADLLPHIDREQCEFSISFQVDYEPEADDILPWSLHLSPLELANNHNSYHFPWENYLESNQSAEVKLKSGDGVFYKGRELVHYRYPLPKNHQSTSIFFHYVAKDFAGKLD